jgi:hypothetical protein
MYIASGCPILQADKTFIILKKICYKVGKLGNMQTNLQAKFPTQLISMHEWVCTDIPIATFSLLFGIT